MSLRFLAIKHYSFRGKLFFHAFHSFSYQSRIYNRYNIWEMNYICIHGINTRYIVNVHNVCGRIRLISTDMCGVNY